MFFRISGERWTEKSTLMQYSCFKLRTSNPLPTARPSSLPQISALPHCLFLLEGYKGRCETLQSNKFSVYPSSSITKLVQLNTLLLLLLLLLLLFGDLFGLRIVQGHQTILYALFINTHDQQPIYALLTAT